MQTEPIVPGGPSKTVIRIEDALIGLTLVAFMVLALGSCEVQTDRGETYREMWRDTTFGRGALVGLAVVMFVLFVVRLRRVHRAFRKIRDEDGGL